MQPGESVRAAVELLRRGKHEDAEADGLQKIRRCALRIEDRRRHVGRWAFPVNREFYAASWCAEPSPLSGRRFHDTAAPRHCLRSSSFRKAQGKHEYSEVEQALGMFRT